MADNIKTKSGRAKLAPRREPYWYRVEAGLFVGFRRLAEGAGTWIARRTLDDYKKTYHALGDLADVDEGERFKAAYKLAEQWKANLEGGISTKALTVADACRHYVQHQREHESDANANDAEGRFRRLVYSAAIGKVQLARLKTTDVRTWLSAQLPKADPDSDEGEEGAPIQPDDVRRAKDSANRNLSALKAALNLALKDRLIATDAGWKTVTAYGKVGRRRQGLILPEQRAKLLAACPDDLAGLVKAMLLTGARPGELASATVQDFNRRQGTLAIADGKTGYRVVTLSSAAIAFLSDQAKDRIGNAPLLPTEFGKPWNKDTWKKPFKEAVKSAGLPADIVLYSLRHTAISELIADGMDSHIVAQLTGTSTAMIDKHYGHLRHEKTRALLDRVAMMTEGAAAIA